MGQYMHLNIAETIILFRNETYTDQSVEYYVELGNKMFDLSHYTCEDVEEGVIFTLKEDILCTHLSDFLKEQYLFLGEDTDPRNIALVEGVKCMHKEEILLCAEKQTLPPAYLHHCHLQWNPSLLYLAKAMSGYEGLLNLRLTGLSYYSMGKTYIESEESRLLHSVHSLMRSSSKNPLAKTTFINLQ